MARKHKPEEIIGNLLVRPTQRSQLEKVFKTLLSTCI